MGGHSFKRWSSGKEEGAAEFVRMEPSQGKNIVPQDWGDLFMCWCLENRKEGLCDSKSSFGN